MVAVERAFPRKQKICLVNLLKTTTTFILDNGGTYKINDSNKKIVFVLEKAYAENEDMNI